LSVTTIPAPPPLPQHAAEHGGRDRRAPLWTVTVDHGGALLDDELDTAGLDALVRQLQGRVVAVSHRPRRFTTTVRLHDTDALAAASRAADLVRDTARDVGLPAWPLVHLEVVRRDRP
jgi:hypothetical protein